MSELDEASRPVPSPPEVLTDRIEGQIGVTYTELSGYSAVTYGCGCLCYEQPGKWFLCAEHQAWLEGWQAHAGMVVEMLRLVQPMQRGVAEA